MIHVPHPRTPRGRQSLRATHDEGHNQRAAKKQGKNQSLIDKVNILVADPCKPGNLPEQHSGPSDRTGPIT